jgi:CopG antitoxin of type II toxin-antitoxin system
VTQQKPKKHPDFKSVRAERAFWATHDNADYFDWSATSSTRLPVLEAPPRTWTQRVRELLVNLQSRFRRNADDDARPAPTRRRR